MEKLSAKGLSYALLPVLLLQFSSLVAAVDIIFYTDSSACDGSGISYNSIGPNVCCEASPQNGGSVLVTSTSGSSDASSVFTGSQGGCTNQAGTGSGDVCYVGGDFTGAFWYNARRRSLLTDNQACDSQMKPNGLVYTDDNTKGHWILTTADVAEMYSQMQKILDAERVNWLQSLGATYKHL